MQHFITAAISRHKAKKLENRHGDEIDDLRNGLFTNLAMDVAFEDFPNPPKGLRKTTTEAFCLRFRVIVDQTAHNNSVSVVVKRDDAAGGAFLGTLRMSGRKLADVTFILPDDLKSKAASDRLMNALDFFAIHDESQRTGGLTRTAA